MLQRRTILRQRRNPAITRDSRPKLEGAVVYYGNVPGSTATAAPAEEIARIGAPVLGLYGGNDARINATLPPTITAMMQHDKTYEFHTFERAGHGFLHRQDGADGANLSAARHAWPLTLTFLRRHLGQVEKSGQVEK